MSRMEHDERDNEQVSPPEVRERAVRIVLNNESRHESRWSSILPVPTKIGCAVQTLNEWVNPPAVQPTLQPQKDV